MKMAPVHLLFFAIAVTTAMTIQQAINKGNCSTSIVRGISLQLVRATDCVAGSANAFANLRNVSGVRLASDGVRDIPFLQKSAAGALAGAIKARGGTISINSALRTVPQQLLLYQWYLIKKCGTLITAKPGQSNHQSGLALDVAQGDRDTWRSALTDAGFVWLGAKDPPHYDFKGTGAVDLRSASIRAFQKLWNLNNPSDKISEDGVYGPNTERVMLLSPADGFPRGRLC